jgi:hypothetical protein
LARRGSSHEITSFPNRAAALPRSPGRRRSPVALPKPERGGQACSAAQADWPGEAPAGCVPVSKRLGTPFPAFEVEGFPDAIGLFLSVVHELPFSETETHQKSAAHEARRGVRGRRG